MKPLFRNAVTIAAVAGLMAGAAVAQSAFDGAVKARKSQMQLQGFNVGPLGAMAKGEVPYDAAVASMYAANLAALSSIDFAAYFPAGSAQGEIEGTRALPAIWANAADFEAKHVALKDATVALAAAAGNGLDALKGALGPVGQACGSCHETYRQPQ